jgi:hypothetical protein
MADFRSLKDFGSLVLWIISYTAAKCPSTTLRTKFALSVVEVLCYGSVWR